MLIISQRDRDRILAHANQCMPEECCGLLVGSNDNSIYKVDHLLSSTNVSTSDRTKTFEIDPKLRFDLLRKERNGELAPHTLLGSYHSHPHTEPFPSETDKAMAFEPDLIWVICDLTKIRAFIFNVSKQDFDELPIQVTV